MTHQPSTPAQRLHRSLITNPYAVDNDTPTTEFAPVLPSVPPDTSDVAPGRDGAVQPPGTITVTAMYAATIFEGEDNVYRYDLPLSAIQQGGAVADVVDQVRVMAAETWPNVNVLIDAPGQAGPALITAFQQSGASANYVDSLSNAEGLDEGHQRSGGLVNPRPDANEVAGRAQHIFHPFHAAIAIVVLAVCGISWWALDNAAVPETATPSQDFAAPSENFGEVAPPSVEPAPSSEAQKGQDEPVKDGVEMVSITQGRTTIELPIGYEVTKVGESELVTLTGNDPDFRILMAANPMEEGMLSLANISQRVANSSTFASRPDESFVGGRNVVAYMENPSDGSTAHWYVWGEAGHQMSVGCHWRKEVSVERQSDCETAVRTLKLSAGQ